MKNGKKILGFMAILGTTIQTSPDVVIETSLEESPTKIILGREVGRDLFGYLDESEKDGRKNGENFRCVKVFQANESRYCCEVQLNTHAQPIPPLGDSVPCDPNSFFLEGVTSAAAAKFEIARDLNRGSILLKGPPGGVLGRWIGLLGAKKKPLPSWVTCVTSKVRKKAKGPLKNGVDVFETTCSITMNKSGKIIN